MSATALILLIDGPTIAAPELELKANVFPFLSVSPGKTIDVDVSATGKPNALEEVDSTC